MNSYSGELLRAQEAYTTKGLKAGAKSLPATTAIAYDPNETQLIADAQRFALNEHSKYKRFESQKDKVLADLQNELSSVSASCDALLDDESLSDTARGRLDHERRALIDLREKVLLREADVRAYKQLNGITEEAVYPENSAAPYIWLLPAVAVETALNTNFYETANGILGGAVVAFGVSALNIGLAFTFGCLYRYKNLQDPMSKVSGYLALAAAILLSVYCNALFAAFRTEYAILDDPSDLQQGIQAFMAASGSAARIFLLDPPATDLPSFLLFFMGLGLSIFAFIKGKNVDDRHPGYGPRSRLLKEAEDAYELVVERVKAAVKKELETKREGIAQAKTFLGQAHANLQQVKTGLDVEYRKMQANLTQIQRDFAHVLNAYRQSNVSVRPIDPPAYFSETPDLVAQYAAEPAHNLEQPIIELDSDISRLKDTYLVPLTDKLRDITNEARVILGKAITAFLDDVTTEAKRNINDRVGKMPAPSLA